jgi:response regulator RpfG family c-di-GMP phosphodiesterase
MTSPGTAGPPPKDNGPWRVLVVDDERDVHDVTAMIFKRFQLDGRPLELLHAFSAEEAKRVLQQTSDVALMLLDVVMETERSGLELVRWCREVLGNRFMRIALLTGQPGQAPQQQVIVDYDINDYREKTDLDQKRFYTVMITALRGYRDIMAVERAAQLQLRYRNGLERVLKATNSLFEYRQLADFASGLLQQIMAVLRLNEKGVLVQVRGVSGVHGGLEGEEFEVLASVPDDATSKDLEPDLKEALSRARVAKASGVDGDIFIGYYPSRTPKATLLALKGVGQIDEIDMQLLRVFSSSIAVAFDNILLNQEVLDTQGELIHRMGDAVESRSDEVGFHVKRMSELSYRLALAHGLSPEEADIVRRAAPMHDIGKIATPDAVLLKKTGLTAEEWVVMKRHPELGHSILDGSKRPVIAAAAIIAHQHHEKVDGTGYPQGLKGDAIHLYARLIAVADVFDALSHARCYKPAWPLKEVLKYMQDVSGSHLDPVIVGLLLDHLDQALAINEKYPG